MNNFNFSLYDPVDTTPQPARKSVSKKEKGLENAFDFSQYEPNKIESVQPQIEETDEFESSRHGARLTSRALEQVLGLPGNIRDFAKFLKKQHQKPSDLSQKTGLQIPKEPELFQKFEQKFPVVNTISKLLDYLPTSSQVRQFSEEKSGGFTKPEGEFEEIADNIFENIVSSALPGSGKKNIWRNLAVPVISVLGKEGVKRFGGSEKAQALTEIGLAFGLTAANRANAPKLNKEIWKDVTDTIPNVRITPLENNKLLTQAKIIENQLGKGLQAPSEKAALEPLRIFIKKLEQGPITAEELVASNRSLNEIRYAMAIDPSMLERGKTQLNRLSNIVHEGVENVGKQDKEWYKKWLKANEIHGAIAHSDYISKVIEKAYTKPFISEGMRSIFGAGTHVTAKAAGSIPPVYLAYKATQVLDRIVRSPELYKHYLTAVKAAFEQNIPLMSKNIEFIDKKLAKEESDNSL